VSWQLSYIKCPSPSVKESKQEVKVIWQKAPHGGPIPRLGVTPGGRKLYHWIPGVGFPISVIIIPIRQTDRQRDRPTDRQTDKQTQKSHNSTSVGEVKKIIMQQHKLNRARYKENTQRTTWIFRVCTPLESSGRLNCLITHSWIFTISHSCIFIICSLLLENKTMKSLSKILCSHLWELWKETFIRKSIPVFHSSHEKRLSLRVHSHTVKLRL